MMKKYLIPILLFLGIQSSVSALSCVDLSVNVSRYQETASVRALQDFLYEKGHLKAAPNGYFGAGTLNALKAYQKDKGITQTGTAGPLTRATIKSESCNISSSAKTATSTAAVKTTVTATSPVVTTTAPAQPKPVIVATPVVVTKNERRWNDGEMLLKALYSQFSGSRGVWVVGATSSLPTELCVAPKITQMASTSEVAIVTTAASPCLGYVDISNVAPTYLPVVPRDPSLATSSTLIGYTIFRTEYGDVTIAPKTTDNKEMIRIRCNFIQGCKSLTRVTQEEYGVPFVTTLSRTIVLRDSLPKAGITVTGRNFAATNTVVLQSKATQRLYEAGTFSSTDGKTFVIDATTTTSELSCGTGCREKLPIGEYSVQLKTQGGESNVVYITVKGFTTSSISARANSTVAASSSAVKIGTITISSSLPSKLISLTLRATTTSSKLPGKITNFKLKDLVSNQTISAGGLTFGLSNIALADNASRFYDLYADVGNVLVNEASYITYGGTFLIRDTIGGVDIELPMKEISFSVSP